MPLKTGQPQNEGRPPTTEEEGGRWSLPLEAALAERPNGAAQFIKRASWAAGGAPPQTSEQNGMKEETLREVQDSNLDGEFSNLWLWWLRRLIFSGIVPSSQAYHQGLALSCPEAEAEHPQVNKFRCFCNMALSSCCSSNSSMNRSAWSVFSHLEKRSGVAVYCKPSLQCGWLGERPLRMQQMKFQHRVHPSNRMVIAGLEEISQNQVLASAALAGVLAQLLKPFTSAVTRRGFNWRLILKSGGMPSSHSAAVVAAATALGLERGLSDSLFGLAVVMASIVMYDAQGVRRAVGKQAEVINTMVFTYMPGNAKSSTKVRVPIGASVSKPSTERTLSAADQDGAPSAGVDSEKSVLHGPYARPNRFFETAETLPSMKDGEVYMQEIGDQDGWRHIPLKESVGHTKPQVFAGAIFGATITIISHSILK